MGKWLAKFSADIQESRTDKADTVGKMATMSGMSVRDRDVSAKLTPSQPADEPAPPLQAGWLVCYRDRRGALCGGGDDRQHGTVQECRWDGKGRTVHLTDGQRLPLTSIRAVGQTDKAGEIVAAWTVREHGYDGEGPVEGRSHRAEP